MTTESLPDYQLAASELAALFASLNLAVSIHGPRPGVDGEGKKAWPHMAYVVTFTGKRGTASFDWKAGRGHAEQLKTGKFEPCYLSPFKGNDWANVRAMRQGKTFPPMLEAELACRYVGKYRPNAGEILADACRDGVNASGQSFADWASDFGYDTDSRKALATYEACQESLNKALKVIDRKTAERLAELSSRL